MIENIKELEKLFNKIQENRKTYQVPENISLEELKEICDSSDQLTSIVEMFKYSITVVYSNQKVYDYLNVTEKDFLNLGFSFFLKVLHPENVSSIYLLIKFFSDPKNKGKIFSNTYYAKTKNGWEWVYNSMKPVTFNEDGSIKYMLSASCGLEELLKSKKEFRNLRKNLSFYEQNMEKYLSLTGEEKEVLELIAKELSTEEIADALHISKKMVDKISETLIQKLNVKSAVGLAKYALHFQMVK